MANGIRTINPCGLNKGFVSKFFVDSRVWQETPEEGWRIHRLKHCEYNNKDEDNSLNTVNDKNYQASSKKFRQILLLYSGKKIFTLEWVTLLVLSSVAIFLALFSRRLMQYRQKLQLNNRNN